MRLRKREKAMRAFRRTREKVKQFDSEKEEAVACCIVLILILVFVTVRGWLV